MIYDFDEIISRKQTNSYKWDSYPDQLPLWVADMDFRTAPAIIQAIEKRAAHGIFGYVRVPDAYYESLIRWFERRHNWVMKKQWIIYVPGVVPAISAIIKAMTQTGDKVLVQTPVYNCFFSSIRNNGCQLVCNELIYKDNTYYIDFEDLERKASDPAVKLMIICNPHNPTGRVWTAQELLHIGEICLRHNVFVISDEIHCELVLPGHKYTPYGSLSEELQRNAAICTSPSKAFNTAGLQIANITVADENIRSRIDKAININEVCDVNPFGVEALMAAYNQSEDWLEALLGYLEENYLMLKDFFKENLPLYPVTRLEGTYLVWIDCSVRRHNADIITRQLMEQNHLLLNSGEMYGQAGRHFVRINIACPRKTLKEALIRLAEAWG